MSDRKPKDLSAALNWLAPVSPAASAQRNVLRTRHGELDFARRTTAIELASVVEGFKPELIVRTLLDSELDSALQVRARPGGGTEAVIGLSLRGR